MGGICIKPIDWLSEKYVFWEVFQANNTYFIEFCLRENLKECIDSCYKHNIPYTFYPEYKMAIKEENLSLLMKKEEIESKRFSKKNQVYSPLSTHLTLL